MKQDRFIPRWRDEAQLRKLRALAVDGMSGDQVGQRFGGSRSSVLGLVKRIRDDDIQHSCGLDGHERPEDVAGAYVRGNCDLDKAAAVFK